MDVSRRREALFGALLRHWRTRRGLSQLDLSLLADVSSRHLSFLETGRSQPSESMVLRLASALDVPLRQVNALLRSAGFEPRYPDTDQLPAPVQRTVELMKAHHEPFPLVVMDRSYEVLDLNHGAVHVLGAALPELGAGDVPLNLARVTVDRELGGRVLENHQAVARELMWRVQRELLLDPGHAGLQSLADDLLAAPDLPHDWRDPDLSTPSAAALDLRLRVGGAIRSFAVVLSALLVPLEVAVDELRVELWFPSDDATARWCASLPERDDEDLG